MTTPSTKAMLPSSYHLTLFDKTERDIKGTDAHVDTSGALVIRGTAGASVIYAPGTWLLCELERKDDKG
jgi:hypothetical protein